MITEAQMQAAVQATEEDTIQRCADVVRTYAATKTDGKGKSLSRIAAAKQMAALELVGAITSIPRKSA